MGATPEPHLRWYEIPGHPFYVPQRIPGGPVTIPDTPQPHWTVFYAPGDPLGILIWNNQWSLPMPDAGPEAYAALVADVEAAREVEDLRVTLDVTSARCREELDRVVTDRDALAATLATPLWTCPDCAFTYAAEHTDTETGENSCPVCAEAKLAYTLATARRLAQQWQTADIIDRIVLSKRLVRLLSDTPDTEERS